MLLPTTLQQTCFKCSSIPDSREVRREACPPFGQFLQHLHHWSSQGVCASQLHMVAKNDFMINSQRILKALWSFVYYLERRRKGWWSRSTIQSNKMLESFKSTSLSLAWRPKATEEHTSPPFWPSCLCFVPEFAPNAHLLLPPASPGRPGP